MIKAITFDFWSTLYQNNPNITKMNDRIRFLQLAINEGSKGEFSFEAVEHAAKAARTAWNYAWVKGHRTMGAEEWLAIVFNALNVTLEDAYRNDLIRQLEEALLDNLPILVTEAQDVLAKLASQFKLAIISDTGLSPGRVLNQILQQDEIADYFTHFTFSDEIGYSKPHPNAFLSTLEALDVTPKEAFHVGDLLRTDIAGAQSVGMKAVQYVGVNRDNPLEGVTPDAIVNSHTQLKAVINHWQ